MSDPPTAPASQVPSLDKGLLLECVVTSTGDDGTTNIAPMGPIVDPAFQRVLLRPYEGSTTLANLIRERQCVLNITDDVELIARAALNLLKEPPALEQTPDGAGRFLAGGCRWYSLSVDSIDTSESRSQIVCTVTDGGRLRDFVGFNRAMHAVIEATILATRLDFLSLDDVQQRLLQLASPVEKTGGPRERRAFALVREYVANCSKKN